MSKDAEDQNAVTWWHCRHEESEVLQGPEDTREAAIQAGSVDYDGEEYFVVSARMQKYRTDIFDGDFVAEWFADRNEELAPEEGAAADWTREQIVELERELEATLGAWIERHGLARAWALDTGAYERIPARQPNQERQS